MSHHRLFIRSDQLVDTTLTLSKEKYRHLVKVSRLKKQERLECVTDTTLFGLTVLDFGGGQIQVRIEDEHAISSATTPHITLIQCLPKLDKFSDILRRCTELGVREFVPCISERVDNKDQQKKIARWESVLESAAEQSHQLSIPTLHPITSLNDCHQLATVQDSDLKLVCWEEETTSHLKTCLDSLSSDRPTPKISIFIGPEGGLTSSEVELLSGQDFRSCLIADSVLRVENAGFLVCANVLFYFS